VEPKWLRWMHRWPSPHLLAGEPAAEAIRAWQGLGYPRRALRLHAAAGTITAEHNGEVPDTIEDLRGLPGVGEYTAAAVSAFAFGQPVAVLDTNVRRVLSRWLGGIAAPATSAITRAERNRAEALLPGDGPAATWSVAVMELGALVCTARNPQCDRCPLRGDCAWLAAGRPPGQPLSKQPPFAGSDRQARGFLLRRVTQHGATTTDVLLALWADELSAAPQAPEQAARALASLVTDGLLEVIGGSVALPSG